MQDPASAVNAFDIDTKNPTGTVSVSDTLLSDGDVGGTFNVTVSYSETMEATVAPTITFDPDVLSTLTPGTGAWNANSDVYTASYTIADANVTLDDIDVQRQRHPGRPGQPQLAAASLPDAFDINTVGIALTINNFTNPINAANQAAAAIDGTTAANAQIDVAVTDGTDVVTATTTADASGAWSVSGLDLSGLADGDITYNVNATDADGNMASARHHRHQELRGPRGPNRHHHRQR